MILFLSFAVRPCLLLRFLQSNGKLTPTPSQTCRSDVTAREKVSFKLFQNLVNRINTFQNEFFGDMSIQELANLLALSLFLDIPVSPDAMLVGE